LKTFEETKGFEVGAGLDFVVADVGASGDISSSTLQKPLVVFVWGQQGLMAGVKVEGQKITRLEND
jgi:lipid-binding SYLF domain-containing protein